MRKQETIHELADSYINGNISYVKEELKRYSQYELLEFVSALSDRAESIIGALDWAIDTTQRLVKD